MNANEVVDTAAAIRFFESLPMPRRREILSRAPANVRELLVGTADPCRECFHPEETYAHSQRIGHRFEALIPSEGGD